MLNKTRHHHVEKRKRNKIFMQTQHEREAMCISPGEPWHIYHSTNDLLLGTWRALKSTKLTLEILEYSNQIMLYTSHAMLEMMLFWYISDVLNLLKLGTCHLHLIGMEKEEVKLETVSWLNLFESHEAENQGPASPLYSILTYLKFYVLIPGT